MMLEWLGPDRLGRYNAMPAGDARWCLVLLADMRDPRIVPLLAPSPLPTDYQDETRPATGDRAYFLARRAVLRSLLARLTGCDPASAVVRYDAQGAPRVENPAGLFVSVAGHGPWAMLAIANRTVGVDFEPVLADIEPVKDVLHPDELAAMEGLSASARPEYFLRIWTAKEAYLKALGRGFLDDPVDIAMRFPGSTIDVERNGVQQANAMGEFMETTLDGTPVIAACFLLDEPV